MDNNNSRGSTALAFMVGALAGGITALLFAPQTGAQMRRRLQRGAHDLQEKGGDLARTVEEKAETVVGAMKGAMAEAQDTYRNEVEKRHTASEAKRHAEAEMAGNKPRTGNSS